MTLIGKIDENEVGEHLIAVSDIHLPIKAYCVILIDNQEIS